MFFLDPSHGQAVYDPEAEETGAMFAPRQQILSSAYMPSLEHEKKASSRIGFLPVTGHDKEKGDFHEHVPVYSSFQNTSNCNDIHYHHDHHCH